MVVREDEATAGQLARAGREVTEPLARRRRAASRRIKRVGARLLPHAVLITFSAAILLPLLWLLRVALTDKMTAYKIPPEWGQASLGNFVEIFTGYPFFNYFLNSVTVAFGATVVALPLAAAIAYAFARYNTGGMTLRLVVLSSQMLPPVILVLPLFTLFLKASLLNTLPGLIAAHLTISLPFLAWLLVAFFDRNIALVEQGGAGRRCDAPSNLSAHHTAHRGTRDSGRRPSLLHPELERIPVCADPQRSADQHPACRSVLLPDSPRRRHLPFVGGDNLRDPAGLRSAALHEAVSDQGAFIGCAEVTRHPALRSHCPGATTRGAQLHIKGDTT